jgi:hypothetical protein
VEDCDVWDDKVTPTIVSCCVWIWSVSPVQGLVPMQTVFRGGTLEKWLDHEGSAFINGLIKFNRLLGDCELWKVEPVWSK